MNKKGFTLTEILVVLAVLTIVSITSVVMYSKAIEKRKEEEFNVLCEQLEVAADVYVTTKNIDVSNTTSQCKVTLSDLQSVYLIDNNIVNPITNVIITDICVHAYKDTYNNVVYDACDSYSFYAN